MTATSSVSGEGVTGRLADKVCLITGATGIAARTALLAAREGARLFIASLHEDDCRALASEVEEAAGRPCAAYHAGDLTNSGVARTAVENCVAQFGRMDALFNVAGGSGRHMGDGPVHECTDEGWDATLALNAKSTFLMCRETVRQMLQQEPIAPFGLRGCIVNTGSVLATAPEPNFFATHAYAASKGAVLSLSRAMAAHYAPHKIRVNVLAPALVRTPMSRRAQENPDIVARMKTKQPLVEDLLDPDTIAHAAVFLLSDEAAMITGQVFDVDGGWSVSP
jgi:NAD(P)-dependent dehydrogenase (short-subunit alcohol dehydrogenase family)